MLINKYPAYVNVNTRHEPLPKQAKPEEITISGEKALDLQQMLKRRRIMTPIRITPFLYSLNPVDIEAE